MLPERIIPFKRSLMIETSFSINVFFLNKTKGDFRELEENSLILKVLHDIIMK